ncbi:MAG: hypothetical protein JST89_17320 [Cyanobacteria bacterium SZAS-4]|nr:hypothetical protein [Cyanobacteria bacterium SZAS-4]
MQKRRVHLLLILPLFLQLPSQAQGTMEFGSVHAAAVGLGAGLAASRGHGQVVRQSYEAMLEAQKATLAQTKAIEQYTKLGCELESKKRWSEAEKSFTYVLKVVALRDGPGSPKSVPALQHLVTISKQQGNLAEAIDFQKTILAFSKSAKVPDPQAVLRSQVDLSNLFIVKNDYTSAEPVLREALAMNSPAIPREKRRAAVSTYAELLRKLHRDAEADALEAASPAPTDAAPSAAVPVAPVQAGTPAIATSPAQTTSGTTDAQSAKATIVPEMELK